LLLALMMMTLQLSAAAPGAQAAPKPKTAKINITPTITSLNWVGDHFVASGIASVRIDGTDQFAAFSNVPVNLGLAADQTGAGACPILDLELGPINLNLLGLVVETSPICLRITAVEGGGLLGDLLCAVANLLDGGLTLDQILAGQGVVVGGVTLPGLTLAQLTQLNAGLISLLNKALEELPRAILDAILPGATCDILHLELGPLELNLLGLVVELDDCAGGPVVVDITGQSGLLGELLCGLLGDGLINLGDLLQEIIDLLEDLLNQ